MKTTIVRAVIIKAVFLIGLTISFAYTRLQAQSTPPLVEISGSQLIKYTSKIISGQEYELLINLPGDYQRNTGKKYPVIYLLDAQWDFPLVYSIYGQQYYDGYIPAAIVVGIRWGGKNPKPDSLRARDFTPTNVQGTVQSGGAQKFLSFIKTELIPFIESKYRVSNDRTLIGSSLGGLFTLYTLFNEPDVFKHYVLTSPSVQWDNEVLYSYEKSFGEKKLKTPVTLSMAVGEFEGLLVPYNKFVAHLRSRNYKDIALESRILENTGHSGTKAEGYTRGLQFAFSRPSLKLPESLLNEYVGDYELRPGVILKATHENGQLVVTTPDGNKIIFLAETPSDFYIKGQYLRVRYIKDSTGKVSGARVEQFGGEDYLKKLN
jgi:predicted alpha/beta superfamily hydrolase